MQGALNCLGVLLEDKYQSSVNTFFGNVEVQWPGKNGRKQA